MLNFNTREFPNLARALGGWGKGENPVVANFHFSREGAAGGGGWGEESRHARAKNGGQPRRPARQSRAPQKSFLFLLEEKIGRAQIRKSEENFFVGRAGLRHGGGAASLGVSLEVGSDFLIYSPHSRICEGMRLGASPLGAEFRQIIPRLFERNGQHACRKAAVPKQSLDCARGARADGRFLQIVGVSALPFSNAIL